MRAGGWLVGVMAPVTVVVIGSQAFCDRMVTLKVCRFVPARPRTSRSPGPIGAGSPSAARSSACLSTSRRGTSGPARAGRAAPLRRTRQRQQHHQQRHRATVSPGHDVPPIWRSSPPQDRLQQRTGRPSRRSRGRQQLGHGAASTDAGDVRTTVDGQRDRLTRAPMRQADVGGQDAMRQPRQCLLGGVRVNRAQAAEMAGVQRLQQVERFRAAHLADQDPIRPVPQRGPEQVGDRDRRAAAPPGRAAPAPVVPRGAPRSACQMNLGRLLDDDHAVVVGNVGRQRIQQRRLSGPRAAGDQDVLLAPTAPSSRSATSGVSAPICTSSSSV